MSWPDTATLEAVLVSDGIMKAGEFGIPFLERWAAIAQRYIATYTNWNPIFSTGVDEVRTFTPNGTDVLSLTSGLLSLTSLTVGSTALVENEDFWLMGEDGDFPNHWVKFASRLYGIPKSISIDGEWGFVASTGTLPADMLNAYYGLVGMLVWLAKMPNEGPVSEKEQKDLRIRFANYYVGNDVTSGKTKYDLLYLSVYDVLDYYKNVHLALSS